MLKQLEEDIVKVCLVIEDVKEVLGIIEEINPKLSPPIIKIINVLGKIEEVIGIPESNVKVECSLDSTGISS